MKVYDKSGESIGEGTETDLMCAEEGCNGTQYLVEWEDGEITIVCGKGLKWLDEDTAQII